MKEIKMKKFHIILPVFVVVILIMLTPIIRAEAAEGKPGQTVTVTFSFNDIRGLDGVFSFSDKEIFNDISYSSSFQGVRFNNNKVFYSTTAEEATAGTITVTATIKEDASVGSKCTVTLGDINVTDANTNSVYSGSKSEVVNVVEEPVATKEPAKPTATPASQSGGQNGNQSSNQNSNQNQVQNITEKPGDNQGGNNGGSQSIEVTKQPQNNNSSDNNNSGESSSIEATRTATISPSETPASEIESSKSPDKSIEANAGANAEKNKKDNDSNGKSFWIILLILSIIANLILAGILIWRKVLKNADTGKDTPLVDYDINEDDEPLETEEIE